MKPTLEKIQTRLKHYPEGSVTHYALTLAEQVALGEVVLVETGNYAAMLNAMPRELKQMLPQPPQEASDERD